MAKDSLPLTHYHAPQTRSFMLPYGTYDETIEALAGALRQGSYILGERFSAADVVVG